MRSRLYANRVLMGTGTYGLVQIFNGGETRLVLRDDDGDRRDTATPAHTATMSPVTHAACFPWGVGVM